jgi:solute carrier family 25 phosphate transporter 23/24/25/41
MATAGQHQPANRSTIAVSGVVAGAVSRTATAPLDRLKVLCQAAPGAQSGNSLTGVYRGMSKIYQQGGARAYFVGNFCNIVKVAPETAVKFIVFDEMIARLSHKRAEEITPYHRLAAGAAAGICGQAAIYPLEVCKTKMMLTGPNSSCRTIMGTLVHTVRTAGTKALYLGLGPSLVGIAPYSGVDMALFTYLRDRYKEKQGKEAGPLALLLCGIGSSSIAMWVTYPLQLIRTKMQAQTVEGAEKFRSARDCVQKTIKRDGMRGLYKGLLPNFLKGVPAIAISYTVFETTKQALQRT